MPWMPQPHPLPWQVAPRLRLSVGEFTQPPAAPLWAVAWRSRQEWAQLETEVRLLLWQVVASDKGWLEVRPYCQLAAAWMAKVGHSLPSVVAAARLAEVQLRCHLEPQPCQAVVPYHWELSTPLLRARAAVCRFGLGFLALMAPAALCLWRVVRLLVAMEVL
jgi:hypothetical protein